MRKWILFLPAVRQFHAQKFKGKHGKQPVSRKKNTKKVIETLIKKFLKGKKVGEEKTLDFSDTKFIELPVFCGLTNFFGALPKKLHQFKTPGHAADLLSFAVKN